MFGSDGRLVLTRRYCGSKMRACDAVEKRTSSVRVRMMLKENGEAVKLNLISAFAGEVLESADGRGRTKVGTS